MGYNLSYKKLRRWIWISKKFSTNYTHNAESSFPIIEYLNLLGMIKLNDLDFKDIINNTKIFIGDY